MGTPVSFPLYDYSLDPFTEECINPYSGGSINAIVLMDHLDNQNIPNENQHGFRAKRSCESQLLMTTNDITKWMNNNIQVDIAILDLQYNDMF
jgi:hypothetical protein